MVTKREVWPLSIYLEGMVVSWSIVSIHKEPFFGFFLNWVNTSTPLRMGGIVKEMAKLYFESNCRLWYAMKYVRTTSSMRKHKTSLALTHSNKTYNSNNNYKKISSSNEDQLIPSYQLMSVILIVRIFFSFSPKLLLIPFVSYSELNCSV